MISGWSSPNDVFLGTEDPVILLRGLSAVIYFRSGNSNTVSLLALPAHKAGTQAGSPNVGAAEGEVKQQRAL